MPDSCIAQERPTRKQTAARTASESLTCKLLLCSVKFSMFSVALQDTANYYQHPPDSKQTFKPSEFRFNIANIELMQSIGMDPLGGIVSDRLFVRLVVHSLLANKL